MLTLYIASTCSRKKYAEYIESQRVRVSQQAQKYNLLLAEGFAENGCEVRIISTRPINRGVSRRWWFKSEHETDRGVDFSYVPFINYPVLRSVFIMLSVFFKVLFCTAKKKETVVVCDALNIVASMGALAASMLRGYNTVGIVTDVPCHLSDMSKIPFSQKLNLWVMKRFRSYLLLTEPMSEIVNPQNRPYVVLEGHADGEMIHIENLLEKKADKKICFYAGSLKKVYGIKNLVEGFIAADIPDTELHIYGNGNYVEELQELVKQYDNVKYLGVAPNTEIVKAELAATLLVNPRPTNEEYTKYSFPSKNMEYMASGTPVLTTELPGMPKDHKPYVFLIKDESVEGISEALKSVFENSQEELHEFGNRAKDFILREKNNKAQAKKVLDFISKSFSMEER